MPGSPGTPVDKFGGKLIDSWGAESPDELRAQIADTRAAALEMTNDLHDQLAAARGETACAREEARAAQQRCVELAAALETTQRMLVELAQAVGHASGSPESLAAALTTSLALTQHETAVAADARLTKERARNWGGGSPSKTTVRLRVGGGYVSLKDWVHLLEPKPDGSPPPARARIGAQGPSGAAEPPHTLAKRVRAAADGDERALAGDGVQVIVRTRAAGRVARLHVRKPLTAEDRYQRTWGFAAKPNEQQHDPWNPRIREWLSPSRIA